jgi:hypothetical protein
MVLWLAQAEAANTGGQTDKGHTPIDDSGCVRFDVRVLKLYPDVPLGWVFQLPPGPRPGP